ncbi:formyltetrahydrofolate deformylase [Chloroflexia bacterium SDU3-3]|nr:formyltetrahydrofolate deformylase [Chloroflexia bacterium SDU3-3]
MSDSAILLISCPDRKGIVAGVADFLYSHNANILHADQHQDAALDLFFMRVEWALDDFALDLDAFPAQFAPLAERFQMRWRLARSSQPTRMALFVSRYTHCLADLLYRAHSGELNCSIPLIIGNSREGEELATFYRVPFFHIPVTAQTKAEAEARQQALLDEHGVDLIVLARYMQILSPEFVARYTRRIINVHHSFLPAFSGARPYQRAFERGVKLIGATSHYVTDELDEGPIIEQDVARVTHRNQVEDLVRKGRDLENLVLARAVRWHTEHRIVVFANKTVVFD